MMRWVFIFGVELFFGALCTALIPIAQIEALYAGIFWTAMIVTVIIISADAKRHPWILWFYDDLTGG